MCPARGIVDKVQPVERAKAILPIIGIARCFASRSPLRGDEHASPPNVKVRHLRAGYLIEEVLSEVGSTICGGSDVVAGFAEAVLGCWCAFGHFQTGFEGAEGGACYCISRYFADGAGNVVEARNGSGGDDALDVCAAAGTRVVLEA